MPHKTRPIRHHLTACTTATALGAVLTVGSLAASGCYRHTISADGIGTRYSGERIREPNVEDPDAPLFPWFGDDDEDEDNSTRRR